MPPVSRGHLTPTVISATIQVRICLMEALWKIILQIMKQIDQLLLPNIIYQFILLFLTKSEIQPHHLIVNNHLMNDENKNKFYHCAQQVKICIYQTFYTKR